MEKYLEKQINNMKGSLVGIGIDSEKLKQAIKNNESIKTCFLLEESSAKLGKKKFKLFDKSKTINIKKIKKVFKKKRINNIICNYNTVKPFLKTFIRDSIYINKNKLYIYTTEKDTEELINRYKRYTKEIKTVKEDEYTIIIIDNEKTRNNKLKDIGYWWIDTLANLAEALTTILVN